MAVAYSDLKFKGGINPSHPLAPYVVHAFIPMDGTGGNLWDAAQGRNKSVAGGLLWNSNGSVEGLQSDTTSEANDFTDSASPLMGKNIDWRQLAVITRSKLNNTNNRLAYYFKLHTGAVGDQFNTFQDVYTDGWVAVVERDWTKISSAYRDRDATGNDAVRTLRWDPENNSVAMWDKTTKFKNSTLPAGSSSSITNVQFGVGVINSEFYYTIVLDRPKAEGAFTDAELMDLVNDPYNLFEIADDGVDSFDRHLIFDEIAGYAAIDVATLNYSWDFEFKISDAADGSGDWYRMFSVTQSTGDYAGANTGADRVIIKKDGTEIRFTRAGVTATWAGLSVNPLDAVMFRALGASAGIELFVNGLSQGVQAASSSFAIGFDRVGVDLTGGTYGGFGLHYVKFTDSVAPARSRFYDFNQSSGTVVPELVNNVAGSVDGMNPDVDNPFITADGVEVGGTRKCNISSVTPAWNKNHNYEFEFAASGSAAYFFGRSNSYNHLLYVSTTQLVFRNQNGTYYYFDLDGNYLDGTFHTIRLEATYGGGTQVYVDTLDKGNWGAYLGNITIDRIGSMQDTVSTQLITFKRAYIYAGNNTPVTVDLDFTQANVNSVPNASGSDATLTGFKTSGWQYLYETDEYTSADYADLATFASSEKDSNTVAKVYKPTTTLGATIQEFFGGVMIDGGEITSDLVIETQAQVDIRNLKATNIDATQGVDVRVLNVEADNVTG